MSLRTQDRIIIQAIRSGRSVAEPHPMLRRLAGPKASAAALVVGLALCPTSPAYAQAQTQQLTINLSDPSLLDASQSTGLWNTIDGRIEAALAASGGDATRVVDFGSGVDGAFADGPDQTGISVAGATVTINTSVKNVYQFQSFSLSSGTTLQVTGSQPLILRVRGPVTLDGNVIADGLAGGTNSATLGGSGASGVAGGGAGGAGGDADPDAPGVDGLPAAGVPRGGLIGANDAAVPPRDYQGGGGGCNGWTGVVDNLMNGEINSNRTIVINQGDCSTQLHSAVALGFDSQFLGGGGGGGGGALSSVAPAPASGAGGGSGGGAIRIAALGDVTIGGVVFARGGDGGAANYFNGTADCGAGGGGGSGGSIWIQSARTVSGAGNINVNFGAGGISGTCAGFDGGRGSRGVARIDTRSGNTFPNGNILPASTPDQATTLAIPTGQTYSVTSLPIRVPSNRAAFLSPDVTLGCGTPGVDGSVSIAYQGSTDGVNFGSAVSANNISTLNGSRFVRFVASISTLTSNPPCITALVLPYQELAAEGFSEFKLNGGLWCGSLLGSSKRGGHTHTRDPRERAHYSADVLWLLLAWLATRALKKKLRQKTISA